MKTKKTKIALGDNAIAVIVRPDSTIEVIIPKTRPDDPQVREDAVVMMGFADLFDDPKLRMYLIESYAAAQTPHSFRTETTTIN